MKSGEKGFTLVELLVAMVIMVTIGGAGAAATFQVLKGAERGNSYMSAVRQVENAGHWISRDALMSESIQTDNLTPPNFLILNWVERDYVNQDIRHSATYFFQDVSGNTGKLMRRHWSSAGANELVLVAEKIYYDPAQPGQSSRANYAGPVLTVKLTSIIKDKIESKEYKIVHRPGM